MLFFRRITSHFFTTLVFVSFSFVLSAFVFQQTALAVTKAQCELIAPGSVCKPSPPGCASVGASPTEGDRGICSDVGGVVGSFACCENLKPPADTNILDATCRNFSGADCFSSSCDSTTKNFLARCVTPGAGYSSNSYCCQDKAAATPPAGGVPASSPTPGGVPAPTGSQSISFTNPLLFNTVEGLLGSLLGTLQGIIVVLALVFIVIGAVLYVTSAGNEGQMTLAKGAITAAMIGLALGIAAPSFLKEISGILGWTPAITCPTAVSATVTADDIAKCTAAQATLAAGKPLSEIALNVLNFLLSIVGVLTVIMMVVGGVIYLTAAGNEDQIDTGKKIVNYATIGILVSLASLILVRQIASFFG